MIFTTWKLYELKKRWHIIKQKKKFNIPLDLIIVKWYIVIKQKKRKKRGKTMNTNINEIKELMELVNNNEDITQNLIKIVKDNPEITSWADLFPYMPDSEVTYIASEVYTFLEKNAYKKYQQSNNVIELEKNISDTLIDVSSDSTNFIYYEIKELYTIEYLNEYLKNIRKAAKENSIKLKGINKVSKWIKENHNDYIQEKEKEVALFNELKEFWKDKKIKVGYSNDLEYKEYQKKYFELQNMRKRKTTLGKINEFVSRYRFFNETNLQQNNYSVVSIVI